jgi:hypothetical protein
VPAERARTFSSAVSTTLSGIGSELTDGLVTLHDLSPFDIVQSLAHQLVDFLRRIFLAKIPREHVVIHGFAEKLVRVR